MTMFWGSHNQANLPNLSTKFEGKVCSSSTVHMYSPWTKYKLNNDVIKGAHATKTKKGRKAHTVKVTTTT